MININTEILLEIAGIELEGNIENITETEKENIYNEIVGNIHSKSEIFKDMLPGDNYRLYVESVIEHILGPLETMEDRKNVYEAVLNGHFIGGCA